MSLGFSPIGFVKTAFVAVWKLHMSDFGSVQLRFGERPSSCCRVPVAISCNQNRISFDHLSDPRQEMTDTENTENTAFFEHLSLLSAEYDAWMQLQDCWNIFVSNVLFVQDQSPVGV